MFHPDELHVDGLMAESLIIKAGEVALPPTTWSPLLHYPQLSRFVDEYPEDGRVVDLGCGYGQAADLLVNKPERYLGIDISRPTIERARHYNPGYQFEVRSFRHLRLEPASVDALWCCNSLSNMPMAVMPEILREFKRVLKKGGLLGIVMPCVQSHHDEVDHLEFVNDDPGGDPRIWRFTPHPATLAKLCEAAGFGSFDLRPCSGGTHLFHLYLSP
jgi:SAM-dependent methyltransferase